jgi:hypothetical protein
MKLAGYNVELVTEYAKKLVYDSRDNILSSDQLYILAKQNRKLEMLRDKVDYVITDSPLILSHVYYYANGKKRDVFNDMVNHVYNSYDNVLVHLSRNPEIKYQNEGRLQDLDEARV